MTTINDLKNKIEQLEKDKQSIVADQAIFYTECLKIAIKNDYSELLEYLNADPQDIINAKESLEEDQQEENHDQSDNKLTTIIEKKVENKEKAKRTTDLTKYITSNS